MRSIRFTLMKLKAIACPSEIFHRPLAAAVERLGDAIFWLDCPSAQETTADTGWGIQNQNAEFNGEVSRFARAPLCQGKRMLHQIGPSAFRLAREERAAIAALQ